MTTTAKLCAGLACAAALGAVHATEGGVSNYPAPENFMVGAVPPPGFYALAYFENYASSELMNNNGQQIPIPNFSVHADALVVRPIWSTPLKVLGGNIVCHSILPFVDLRVSVGNQSQSETSFGDMTIGCGLAEHYSEELHVAYALDFVLPTGEYDKNKLANVGLNYMSYEPLIAFTYLDPNGFNGDFKITFNINQKNNATDYQSGDEVFVDYATGWGLGNGWTVGVGGYLRDQFTQDSQNGTSLPNNNAHAFAIGPDVRYLTSSHWFITIKWEQELDVRNTTKGNAFWIKTSIPF